MYSCPTGDWSTCNPSNIVTTVVEDDIGIVFDLVVVDANNDGRLDLVVTNNAIEEKGGAWAYEVPDDIVNGQYTRHTLLFGLTIPDPEPGLGSPGSVYVFFLLGGFFTWFVTRAPTGRLPLGLTCHSLLTHRYSWAPRSRADAKPLIFVCGDDNGKLYQLTPRTEDPRDWNYNVDIIYESVVPGVTHSGEFVHAMPYALHQTS